MTNNLNGIFYRKGSNGRKDIRLTGIDLQKVLSYQEDDRSIRQLLGKILSQSPENLTDLETQPYWERVKKCLENQSTDNLPIDCETFAQLIHTLEEGEASGTLNENQIKIIRKLKILRRQIIAKAVREIKSSRQ